MNGSTVTPAHKALDQIVAAFPPEASTPPFEIRDLFRRVLGGSSRTISSWNEILPADMAGSDGAHLGSLIQFMDGAMYRAYLPAWLTVVLMNGTHSPFALGSLIATLIPEESLVIARPETFLFRLSALDLEQMRAVTAFGQAIQGDPGIAKFTGMDAGARIVEVWTEIVEKAEGAPDRSAEP